MNTTPLYIFDLDGTLADLKHRRHFVERPPCSGCGNMSIKSHKSSVYCPLCMTQNFFTPNWDAFHAACVDDTPIKPVIETLRALSRTGSFWIWSGRMETVRMETVNWLAEHLDIHSGWRDMLKMRSAGDYTPDDVLKESWLKAMSLEDRARLVMVFEDRDRVVNMWRRNSVVCAQVAPGDF